MIDYRLFIQDAISKGKPNNNFEKAKKDAEFQNIIYTGDGQEKVLFEYRKKEDKEQKDQRRRISITRTKHVCNQTENLINWLQMMDTPMVKVISEKNDKAVDDLTAYIYDNNLIDFAFNKVKHFGALLDANAFLKCAENKYGEIEFQVIPVENLYDIYQINDITKAVAFKFERKENERTYFDYELYFENGFYIYKEISGIIDETVERWDKYEVQYVKTNKMFVFPLGFINDGANKNLTSKKTILEPASELFKDLIWKGSDLDVSVATQGINKQFAYAPKCNYQNKYYDNENDLHVMQNCYSGYIYENNNPTGQLCPKCNGTGLQIHLSDQDIISFPLPDSGEENKLRLADLIHTVYINEAAFSFNERMVEKLEAKIMSTIFNHSQINKSEVQVQETATKSIIDLQGVYAMLNVIGKHVSDTFIWMVECIAELKGYQDISVIHGYTLTLKLETIEDLADKRKKLTESNAPIEIIRAIDLAMMQKRHLDDPKSIERYSIWEQYKPFPDKSETSIISFIANLPDDDKDKIMYMYWGNIKRNIEMSIGDAFYTLSHEQRQKLIDAEVQKKLDEKATTEINGNTTHAKPV